MEISNIDCKSDAVMVVRFIDAFADELYLRQLHFEVNTTNTLSFEKIHNCFAVDKEML